MTPQELRELVDRVRARPNELAELEVKSARGGITFLQYHGKDESEKTPAGERFLDNRKFEGPLPEMAEGAINYVLASVRKSSSIKGITREDAPEHPLEAVREAILNALAHRDYSSFVRGSYVQVRLFADRLELQSPGGLYGNVTEENLEEEHSTRNVVLMRLPEDLHLVEDRGSGIRAMIEAMRRANLEPPRFQAGLVEQQSAKRWASYTLKVPRELPVKVAPESEEDRILAYVRDKGAITNQECRELLGVDNERAPYLLGKLVAGGALKTEGENVGAAISPSDPLSGIYPE